jgi:purine catabolism regulator
VPLPTVTTLTRSLGHHLRPARGFTVTPDEITAVHISDLPDPGGYLSGGELLLTTGLSLPADRRDCEGYVARLVEAGVSALALGLGPVHDEVPTSLSEACHARGLTLLVVPEPTPFLTVTRAYWDAVSDSTARQLQDMLGLQRGLVDAAASEDAAGVLRTLSRALGGWAARFSPRGDLQDVHPDEARADAERISGELGRLRGAGIHSAASFATPSTAVLAYPLAVEGEVVGHLGVGTDVPLDQVRRQLVLSAAGLLSLDSVRRRSLTHGTLEAERCVGLLVSTELAAAQRLALATGVPVPTDPLRVLAVRGPAAALLEAVRAWCPEALALHVGHADAQLLLPATVSDTARLGRRLAETDASTTAALCGPVAARRLPETLARTVEELEGLGPGELRLSGSQERDRLADGVEALSVSQVEALAEFLRHRGHWQAAARALGVHRNTIRYRVARCQELLETDLADPDVAAELWLHLRRTGLA